ncbi:MAG: 50S ribosome-binding protein YggL [Candidatus Krumholzibacteria bacterium]|nr:50S ribosome-binding protein YggL [Candidatus Krumholzibacteria bacterium]
MKAFWVSFKTIDGLSVDENNRVIDEYLDHLTRIGCTSNGGVLRPWSWQSLVFASDEKPDVTEGDKRSVIEHLEKNRLLTDYSVSGLVDYEDAEEDALELIKSALIEHLKSKIVN